MIESPTAGRSATPVILAKRPAGCSPAGRRLVQACFTRPGDPSRGAVDPGAQAHDLSGGATSRPTAAANMLQKMSRFTNSEAKACPDLVERFGALRPDERWMTAPRGEVAERADASIRQDSVTQAAWRRFQPLPSTKAQQSLSQFHEAAILRPGPYPSPGTARSRTRHPRHTSFLHGVEPSRSSMLIPPGPGRPRVPRPRRRPAHPDWSSRLTPSW